MMGVLADEVRAAGGNVIGVIPDRWSRRSWPTRRSRTWHLLQLHERKALMADLATPSCRPAASARSMSFSRSSPGPSSSFHAKPIGLLNVNGFLRPAPRMDRPRHSRRVHQGEVSRRAPVDDEAERLLDALAGQR